MTLQEIAKQIKKPMYIIQAAEQYYDEGHVGYIKLLNFVQECTPKKTNFTIHVDYETNDWDGTELESDSYYHVWGSTPDDPDTPYSLGLTEWEEWAGMEVDEEARKKYKSSDILVHCIWEMTFYGWTPDEQKAVKDDLDERVAELKQWEKEGTLDQHTTKAEDLFAQIEREIIQEREPAFDPFAEKDIPPC